MLTTTIDQYHPGYSWDHLQQPVHSSNQQADTLRVLAALDEGWQIQEAANYLASGNNAEGRGYLLTLYNPRRGLTREWDVSYSDDMQALLAFEGLIINIA